MRLLVVEDEATQRRMLVEYLAQCGHDVGEAAAAEEALAEIERTAPDLVLTDVRLPGTDGVELIRRARTRGAGAEFLVVTAFGTIENAVEAMRAGAHDYLTKPIDLRDLDRAIQELGTRVAPAPPPAPDDPFAGLGHAMTALAALADRVARTNATVLVTGETGVGKEIVADRVHARSRRAKGPLVKLNCAALAESLLEAELFGHEKGAFTGADRLRPGLFEAARGGTVFLDEIGDMPPSLQVRLLRVLQAREVLRVGGRKAVVVDFRLIAATHRDLPALVAAGRFREDLLFRLRVVELRVPPLRERREDIPALAERLLRRHAARNAVPFRPLSPPALSLLVSHPFPGNVRELEHLLERALVLAGGDEIAPRDLEVDAHEAPPGDLREVVESLERSAIRAALARCGHVRAQAAKMLGLHDRVLRYKMRKYGIEP